MDEVRIVGAVLAALLVSPASACTRKHDKEIEIVLPAAVHARLQALKGPHARRAAAFLLGHSTHTLIIGIRAPLANAFPNLPLMADNTLMLFWPFGRFSLVEKSV